MHVLIRATQPHACNRDAIRVAMYGNSLDPTCSAPGVSVILSDH